MIMCYFRYGSETGVCQNKQRRKLNAVSMKYLREMSEMKLEIEEQMWS